MNYNYVDLAHTFLWTIFLLGTIPVTMYLYFHKNSTEKKLLKLSKLQQKIFEAQRKGDIKLAGEFSQQAEKLEMEIINESKNNET